MADDGSFKGRGGKPGRKSTVISMSAHKSRHSNQSESENASKKLSSLTMFDSAPNGGPKAEARPEPRTDGSGARAYEETTTLSARDDKALPCENSPFERNDHHAHTDSASRDSASEAPAPRARGRRFLRWGLDESPSNDIFGDPDLDTDLDSGIDPELALALASDPAASKLKKNGAGKSKTDPNWNHKTERSGSVVESFYHAINGLKAGFSGQRNIKIHCVISGLVFILALLLQVDYAGCLALILATGFVLFAEYVNTALEHITDIQAHFRHHQSARLAKDTAAGAVLIAAVTAVLVGLTVFVPRLYALLIGQT